MSEEKTDQNSGVIERVSEKLRVKPKPVLEDVDRISVVFQALHEHCCSDPMPIPCTFAHILGTIEQPWHRVMRVSQEWIPLDLGWLADGAGFLIIRNVTGSKKHLQPSEEEKADLAKKIVVVAPADTDPKKTGRSIRPGHFDFGYPENARELRIRCEHGTAEILLDVIPR